MKTLARLAVGAMALLSMTANAQVDSNALVITSPANGTVVAPGQTITVSVTINSGTYPSGITIIGGEPGGPSVLLPPVSAASPMSFSVTIPANAFPGTFTISAGGTDPSGVLQTSYDVVLDVERTDSPVSLRVDPPSFHIQEGQSLPVRVVGVYADGSWQGLTQSSRLQLTSSNAAVATVQNGVVTATGVGNADIEISYDTLTTMAAVAVTASTSVVVRLSTAATPSSGVAGVTTVNLTASGMPAGLSSSQVTISLAPTCAAGEAGRISGELTTQASSLTSVLSLLRIGFLIPQAAAQETYYAWISGTTTDGTSFASAGCSSIAVSQ
jgi:hypothetical protein